MASGLPDVTADQETAETSEECPGKKKSKFQTFKNFFVKKKRKEGPAPVEDGALKSSQSSDDVNGPEATPTPSDADGDSGSKVSMGNKAMSHDSIFVSDSPSSEANDALASSQDSIHGKVKSLQRQLKQAIRLGTPPSVVCVRKGEDAGALSEDDGLPCSPPEISVLADSPHRSSNPAQRRSSLSLEGSESEDDQSLEASFRPVSPLALLPLDFSEPASPAACLDNSAARHRIAVKHKACAKRKPASREVLESSKVKILSGREPLTVKDERLSAALTEPSAEEKENKDVLVSETDSGVEGAGQQKDEANTPPPSSAQPDSQTDEATTGEGGDSSSSSSEVESDGEEPAWAGDAVPELQESQESCEPDDEDDLQAEEAGSLLQEVLSSLECPLASAFVLGPDAAMPLAGVVHATPESPRDSPSDGLASPLSVGNQEEEDEEMEGDLTPSFDESCGLDARNEGAEPSEEEEYAQSTKGEHHDAEDAGLVEGVLEKEADLLAEGGEEEEEVKAIEEVKEGEIMEEEVNEGAIEEQELMEDKQQEEVLMEDTEREEVLMEEKGQEELAMEEKEQEVVLMEEKEQEEVAMEERKVVIEEEEEEEVTVREEVGEISVEVEMTPLDSQKKAPAEPEEGEQEDDEEEEEVVLATETCEPEAPEESKEVETEVDSGEADGVNLLSDNGSAPPDRDGVEGSEHTMELLPLEVRENASPAQPPSESESTADLDQHPPSSTSPSTDKPSPGVGITEQRAEEPLGGPNIQEDPGIAADSPEPSKVRFTIAPAWQRSLSGGSSKEPPFPAPIKPEAFQQAAPETRGPPEKAEPETCPDRPQSGTPPSHVRPAPTPDAGGTENPFGIKLRKTSVLLRYSGDGSGDPLPTGPHTEPGELPRHPQSGPPSTKPALAKKPDLLEDSAAKLRKTPDPAAGRASGGTAASPSWISVAKQKQKSFQESTLEETADRKGPLEKDEAHIESLSASTNLPNKDKTNVSTSPVTVSCSQEISKAAAAEKEGKRTGPHSPPVPVGGQDEPPWLALAKKKAKAWSEMPQIVQ